MLIEAEWRDPYIKIQKYIVLPSVPSSSVSYLFIYFLRRSKCEWLIKFFIVTVHTYTATHAVATKQFLNIACAILLVCSHV